NFKLLSFGDEAEEDEEELQTVTKKLPVKNNSAHDIAMDPTLSSTVIISEEERKSAIQKIRDKLKSEAKKIEEENNEVDEKENNIDKDNEKSDTNMNKRRLELKAEIRKLKRELHGSSKNTGSESAPSEEKDSKRKKLENPILEEYYQERSKYEEERKKLPKKGTTRESLTLDLLKRFSNKVKDVHDKEANTTNQSDESDHDYDDDDDESWLTHNLNFEDAEPTLAKDANTKDDNWYDITDPRNALNKRRREKARH
ncbi:hypothetical protein Anas_00367, partial [Armadillidium nasatum]